MTAQQPNNRDTRMRFEQWASNPQCTANTVSAVLNVKMAEVAKKVGIKPTFGASPFALGRGEQFERNLLANDGERLMKELRRCELIVEGQSGLLDLRTSGNGGSNRSLRDLEQSIEESLTFLESAGKARGNAVMGMPAAVAALTLRIPRGVMLPEAVLIIDVVAVTPVEIDGQTVAQLTVGEVKTYPDRGGETSRKQLAQARAQLGLYLHALEVIREGMDENTRPFLNEEGFLVMTRPGSDFPSIRTGERLRYQADRAAVGFNQLEQLALELPKGGKDPVDAVLDSDTNYCEACLEFCDLAERCHDVAVKDHSPAVLGDAMAKFLGSINLERASGLLEGDAPMDDREVEIMERLRAAEEPGWE